MAKKRQNMEALLVQGKELIEFYRAHPCTAAYELLGVDLAPIQRLVFRDMWFKNYVIAICGRGVGKTFMLGTLAALSCLLYPGYRVGLIGPVFRQCLLKEDKYSTFWTNEGLNTGTEDFYNSINTGVTKIQSLYSPNTVLNKWENSERECISVNCDKGFEISGTIDHKVLVLDDKLDLDYKALQDLNKKDVVAIKIGFNYFGDDNCIDNYDITNTYGNYINDITLPTLMSKDLSYLLGLLCGDGFIENENVKKRLWEVGFCSEDEELVTRYRYILEKEFNIKGSRVRTIKYGNVYRVQVYSIILWNFLKNVGMSSTTSTDKVIPKQLRKASKESIISFLSGVFDTDGCCEINTSGNNKSCVVSYVSTSKKLCKEIQSVLLNIGIISSFKVKSKECTKYFVNRNKSYICKECYRLRITGTDNVTMFSNEVDFGLERKHNLLHNYIANITKEDFNNTIPGSFKCVWDLATKCKEIAGNTVFVSWYLNKYKKYKKSNYSYNRVISLLKYSESLGIKDEDYFKLNKIIDNKLYFVQVKELNYFIAETIDIEVKNEHCYWANGFINHNSKMIFAEVEKLYDQSSILREASAKKPTRGSDTAYLKFKSVAGKTPSYIEGLPLGDGSKIRGSRFYLILVDELAQVPDQTLDMVVRPMGATSLAPMERVRRLEEQTRLINAGLAAADDFAEEKVNKMVMTSSGYYKFNHMWRRMRDHWKMVAEAEAQGKDCDYAVWQVPYWDLPEGFLDNNNIAEAKRIMSRHEYSMEYEAAMVSDSEGFFKASLLDDCTLGNDFTLQFNGAPNKQYIMGIDPNQGGSASCGVVIIEIGKPNKIVNVIELKKQTTQGLTRSVQQLCNQYNIIRIFMDKGGGGKAVCDLLEEGYGETEPIIDRGNQDHIHLEGRHILDMVNFNPTWIADANFTTKAMFEDKSLLFPDNPSNSTNDLLARAYINIITLKSQLLNIVVTQTSTGILHFDTPTKHMNKDLYSALILGAHGARQVERELEEGDGPILHSVSGLVRSRVGTSFDYLGSQGTSSFQAPPLLEYGLGHAVLKKRIK